MSVRKTAGRILTVMLVLLATGAVTGAPGRGPWSERPDDVAEPAVQPEPWRDSSSAPLGSSVGMRSATPVFPAPGRWSVTLGKAGGPGRSVAEAGQPAGEAPVRVAAAGGGGSLRMEVLDRAAATRLGASGFVFTLSKASRAMKTRLSIDYSGFAGAYGGGYADRLQVLALPGCALTSPAPAGCDTRGVRLPARNDRTARTLAVDPPELAGGSGVTVLAVASAVGGDEGTFAASPLSITGNWQVAAGSGDFTYSYPIPTPVPGGGSAPSVGLNYSSGSIDGLTLATNTQSSPTGLGWSDFANAFIERQYEPCIHIVHTTDLCWKSDNATISLAGISGPLVPANAAHTEWRVQDNPGWKIERTNDAPFTTIHQKQRWKVTGPDGTVYHFGYGHVPGRPTNAILSVPVLADNSSDPCWDTANNRIGSCEQGWRWYLDRVVDPDGNMQALLYEREDNWYSAIGGLAPSTRYHRGATLKEISYGGRYTDTDNSAARVTFGLQWRCGFLVAECPAPAAGDTGFPDVPTDLICNQSSTCAIHSPSFFTGRRYDFVLTEVKVGGAWKPVARYNLYHSFNTGEDSVARKLQLEKIQQVGVAFGKLNPYPNTTFAYRYLNNRVDHDLRPTKAARHNRLVGVTNPFGGKLAVTYGQNIPCARAYNPWPHWDLNPQDCFPQSTVDGGFTRTGVFHKYLVKQVVESPGGGSPDMTTSYAYGGTPAWAFDTGAFARDEDETGWTVWRGYDEATITKGTEKTSVRVFRGWDGDWMLKEVAGSGDLVPVYGERRIDVKTFGPNPLSYEDHPALAGRTLEEAQLGTLGGIADSILQSRRHDYERRPSDPVPGYLVSPEWVGLASTTEKVYSAPGAFRERRSQTTYNTNFQATSTLEEGWLDQAGDERCSITTYADNPAKGMFVYPAVNKKVAGTCASTQVLTQSETYYDGSTVLGAPPVRGNPTRLRTQIDGTRWSETNTEYDTLGRAIRTVGPTGAATTTTYTVTAGAPATQIPIRTTTTNPLGHQVTTDYHPEFGVVRREVNANGNVTEYGYDEFGRLETVWLPTEPIAFAEPSWRFSYDIPNRAVRSRHLTSESRNGETAVFEDAWVIYDGYWRERQAQGQSPVSGKALVSETTYDGRGLLRDETVEQAVVGAPGTYISGASWKNRTRHGYDELGREDRKDWLRDAAITQTTTTAYGTDTVTVTGPDGRKVRERLDGLGRAVAQEEFDGQAWVSSTYRYDLADRLVSVTDPAGNRIDYTYNLAGFRTGQADPNRGDATFEYDDAGNQTATVDARGNRIHTSYDALGRPLDRRSGSPAGTVLAEWRYDTAPEGKGMIHREITHTAGGEWVSEVLGYDDKGRPTGSRLTVPAGLPGLSGQYTQTQAYDRADRIRSVDVPAIGGLPAEKVTTDYNNLGQPTRMASPLAEYVSAVGYDDRGRRFSTSFGPRPGGTPWMLKTWTYNLDQRTSGVKTVVTGSAPADDVVSDHQLSFDGAGNPTEDLRRQNGSAWRECFGYDARSRLTSAYTVDSAASCGSGTPGTGDQPYAHAYEYSPDGKLLGRTENGASTAYTYPVPGARQPHAPTRVGADTYTWDAAGNLASRTVGGHAETLAWDVQGQLQSVTGTGGATSFVYDPSGQRLLRRTPDGQATLYAFGHEITVTGAGAVVTAVRPYTFEGELVATRTLAGLDYVVTDVAGSVELAVPAGGVPSATRAYAPYGQIRARTGDIATDRGFLGQVEDASTGLSYMNARYYDAKVGVFISTDAVYDTGKVKSLNPYSYSANNPATFADPSGLYSTYTYGVELQNSILKAQNKQLIAHIGQLVSHIEELQDVIRKQQRQINKLITYVEALEAEIARQATIIQKLQARVRYLEGVVAAQQREISGLRRTIRAQQAIIRRQAGVIRYYQGVVDVLGFRLWAGSPKHAAIMFSIHSGNGIPGDAFRYDHVSGLQTMVGAKESILADVRAERDAWLDLAVDQGIEIGELEDKVDHLEEAKNDLREELEDAEAFSLTDWGSDALGLIPGPGDFWSAGNLILDFSCGSGLDQWIGDNIRDPLGIPEMSSSC